MKSREYALNRMDLWFVEKIRENYSREFEREVMKELKERIVRTRDSDLENRFEEILSIFSRKNQIKAARNYFSKAYAVMEARKEGLEAGGVRAEDIPREVKESDSYRSVMEQVDKLGEFVRRVRERANQDLTRGLEYTDIDEEFLKTFGDVEGFNQWNLDYTQSVIRFLDDVVRISSSDVEREALIMTQKLVTLAEDPDCKIIKKIFERLERG